MAVDGVARGMAGLALSQTADVAAISALIPTQASASNQLADKEFVNSSVATETAHLVTNNSAPFESVAELEAYTGTVTNNDYAYVVTRNAQQVITAYNRYKYSSATSAWAFEFTLNNSSFTAAQWAAINSGVTAALLASKEDAVTVKTTLDSPLVDNTIYNLGSISTLSLSLPTSDVTPAQAIIVRFTASAAFTVSITGTVAGETSLTTVSGKTYELAFTGNTATGWWLESRYI